MKKLSASLLILILYGAVTTSFIYGQEINTVALKDIQDHWAKEEIDKAVIQGWVNGYEDNTFKPDHTITRAEFVKLISTALNLSKDSQTTKFLLEATKEYRQAHKLNGVEKHWIKSHGYIDPALSFGLVIPSDYKSNDFAPDVKITRREMVVILDRALGLVEISEKEKGIDLNFKDNKEIPDWVKGYIYQGIQKGFINGFPDGSFRHDTLATRAEAVKMIQTILNQMHKGIDKEYKVFVNNKEVALTTSVQIIDGIVYIPARNIISSANPSLKLSWNPVEQVVSFNWEVYHKLMPEKLVYEFNGLYCIDFPARSRMVDGEIMFPIGNYYTNGKTSFYGLGSLWTANWDKSKKEIRVQVQAPMRPNPS